MTTYRGQDTDISYNAHDIAEVVSINLSGIDTDLIEDTIKGDSFKSYKGGLVDGGEISVSCRLDQDATGQSAIVTDANAGLGTSRHVIVTIDTGKTIAQDVVALGYSIDSPEGSSIVGVTYRMKIISTVSVAWV